MKREAQMSQAGPLGASRREFLGAGGKAAVASALAGVALPAVHAGEDNTIRLALIGCGGRGGGATVNAFEAPGGPVKLWAMADLFQHRLDACYKNLHTKYPDKVDVPKERQFIGFDAYRKAMDALRPGDVAIFATYPAWRVVHLDYAVEKGLNVFMEKSFAVDPPAVRRIIKAGEAAEKKGLKIAAGLMCRHSVARQELIKRIRDGELGDILLVRAYRMEPVGPMGRKPQGENEVLWQVRNSIRMLWVSGSLFMEMDIHQIDEICWIKDALPVSAHGVGGRAANSTDPSQNLDSFGIEWTFPDGTKATDVVRYLSGCHTEFATYIHGTKCAAQFSGSYHAGTARIYKDQRIADNNIAWKADKEPCSAWQAEWNVLLDSIRKDKPQNEARRAALSNLADIMGRSAVHMGRIITWDEAMASKFQFCSDIDGLTEASEPPVKPDANGRYPVPIPGKWAEI